MPDARDPETHDPQLYFAEDGNPRSERFGDIYYSLQDGLSETRAVFLNGCHMPDIWADKRQFTVAELGFGTGLNIAALLQMWADNRSENSYLHIFSIEAFLMSREDAARALNSWPELAPFSEAILNQWPKSRQGFHVMDFPQWGARLTLALNDVRAALTQWNGKADAWFLDGFSPALNPDMWAEDVLTLIGQHSRAGARLATFTVAGAVRRGLINAGFEVSKQPGFGKKRERLEAVFAGEALPDPAQTPRILVMGAGIAGCSLSHALTQLGFDHDLCDPGGLGAQASGNRAALVTPRLDAGGGAVAQLYADAHAYATGLYRRLSPQAILHEGVLQRAQTERDRARFEKVATQPCFASDALHPHDDGLFMAEALAVEPLAVLNALTAGRTIHAVPPRDMADYDHVFWAAGAGVWDQAFASHLDLRPVRGQVEVAATPADIPPQAQFLPQAWGGYAIPLPEGVLFGATHDREDRGADVRDADRMKNIDTLSKALPELAAQMEAAQLTSRASVRVTTRDHLPAAGTLSPGGHVLTGLGGRAFCLAPILAHDLVAQVFDLPSPLMASARQLVQIERVLT
ncbi:tRNA (5-methylaminomethyl-2-thiouridine)(34)-methyltransferase MnmD [Asticcacaulis machinosus]|uniref:tRNA 5-methylaminomethyl-2-thiouridine biosynthesis bifunctional protein MnmC n=1 Tax=Asticcacaulis machinosus TaxID=2984211 RepID=A0ABT5HHH0_9CAUL|nr:tRNA (5-methylaminomethyl-2-thiouridine)(34)-methyltransferase MnmD [Asticcacaulis machinosus]MDC7675648.1 tRNA (5-methylaminomethyl-2-thiouridine)(34)-methyltransferase MnmD [Asticcacaulis machinosus]